MAAKAWIYLGVVIALLALGGLTAGWVVHMREDIRRIKVERKLAQWQAKDCADKVAKAEELANGYQKDLDVLARARRADRLRGSSARCVPILR